MKRMKSALYRSIPVFLITVATLILSVAVYNDMIAQETEKCWEWLSVATRTMGEKVKNSFEGNLTLLDHVADAVVLKVDMNQREAVLEYLASVQENPGTIFSRIDLLLPDNTLILQTGEELNYSGELPFEEVLSKGTHVSFRVDDRLTGRPSIYCAAPVEVDGRAEAVLIGRVDCPTLPEQFPSYSYGGNAQVFLIDCTDGSYLMDEWHSELGNIHEMGSREMLEGYENVNFWQEIIAGKEGEAAFISRSNGKAFYMYYMPVDGFNWSVAMMVQEDQVLEDVRALRRTLQTIGIVAGVMLLFYLAWNLFISMRLVAHEEKMRRMEVERIANEAKSSFLSSMSHDIRTPLNGIVGMLDVIERHGDDPAQLKDCLKKIGISTQYLMTLTDDVLDLTEIESGKLQLRNEAFDLHALVEDMNVLVLPKAQEAGVDYHVDCSAVQHPHVLGSAVHLRRVLINLITNAIKYNRENGGIWLTLEELGMENGVGRYAFTVRDTGIGMTREFQQNMFNSFEQEHAGARTKYRGHGLGLTIVSRLVEKMNGDIHVESEKGKGSTFTITLPLHIDVEGKVSAQKTVEAASCDLHGVNILLVEDNELNMEIAQILLRDAGAQVSAAFNGREAVDAFCASAVYDFDVILMDIMMPEMDGLEATRAIRALKRPDGKHIPIIAMTASAFAEDVQRCKEVGMDEHVGKPLDMAEMIAKIARYSKRMRDYK